MGRLIGLEAEKLGDFKVAMHFACRGWLCGADSQRVWRMRVASLNVAPVP